MPPPNSIPQEKPVVMIFLPDLFLYIYKCIDKYFTKEIIQYSLENAFFFHSEIYFHADLTHFFNGCIVCHYMEVLFCSKNFFDLLTNNTAVTFLYMYCCMHISMNIFTDSQKWYCLAKECMYFTVCHIFSECTSICLLNKSFVLKLE